MFLKIKDFFVFQDKNSLVFLGHCLLQFIYKVALKVMHYFGKVTVILSITFTNVE